MIGFGGDFKIIINVYLLILRLWQSPKIELNIETCKQKINIESGDQYKDCKFKTLDISEIILNIYCSIFFFNRMTSGTGWEQYNSDAPFLMILHWDYRCCNMCQLIFSWEKNLVSVLIREYFFFFFFAL